MSKNFSNLDALIERLRRIGYAYEPDAAAQSSIARGSFCMPRVGAPTFRS
jgi:hypothetical protein